jgi:hypothetical protein
MRCKLICAVAAVLALVGVAMADSFTGIITQVKDGKVTITPFKFNKEDKKIEKGDSITLPVADKVKVSKGMFDKETKKFVAEEPVEGGLKNEMFGNLSDKGMYATITTDADNKKITEIVVPYFKK